MGVGGVWRIISWIIKVLLKSVDVIAILKTMLCQTTAAMLLGEAPFVGYKLYRVTSDPDTQRVGA